MKAIIKIKKEVEVKTLEVEAKIDDIGGIEINGQNIEKRELLPFLKGDYWCPIIDIDTGTINEWPKGATAKIYVKVSDGGIYLLKDEQGDAVLSFKKGYVPKIMYPKKKGYGEYIIMNINKNYIS